MPPIHRTSTPSSEALARILTDAQKQAEALSREWHASVTPVEPLTVEQAAQRAQVSAKTIRRRLPLWAEADPPLAWRIGDGPRSPWRIAPAAVAGPLPSVEPRERETAPRGRRGAKARTKPSSTRWQV